MDKGGRGPASICIYIWSPLPPEVSRTRQADMSYQPIADDELNDELDALTAGPEANPAAYVSKVGLGPNHHS